MSSVRCLCATLLLLVFMPSFSHAQVRITKDYGGRIGEYIDRYRGLRASGERVIIDGLCASACTIVLGAVPADRIHITRRAILGFHAAWDFGKNGQQVTNPQATELLYSMYPSNIRRWIDAHGGLRQGMIFLRGKALARMYRQRQPDAYASTAPSWQ